MSDYAAGQPVFRHDDRNALSRIEAVLRQGFAWLRFPSDIEHSFQQATLARRRHHHIVFGLLGIVIFDAFLLQDRILIPDVFELSAWLRLGICTPFAFLVIWLGQRFNSPVLRELLVTVAFVMAGYTLMVLLISTRSPAAAHYYIGLPAIFVFGNTVQRIRFWFALSGSMLLFVSLVFGLDYVAAIPLDVKNTFLLILGAIVCMTLLALYNLEREERRAYLLRLREQCLAREDHLTQLPNRLALEEFLHQRLTSSANGKATSDFLLYLDLDHFKTINDTCGHAVGDRLLREIAGVVRDQVQRTDFIARLGGDEFAVLLVETTEAAARKMGERIIDAVQQFRLTHQDTTFSVAVSIGLVELDGRYSKQTSEVMALADVACYAAKHAGRGRQYQYRHDDVDIALAQRTMDWGQRLRRALDQGSFRLYLQQIVDVHGQVEGYEALVRLQGDDGVILLPASFLPAAKQMGLMTAVDRWVIQQVLSMMATEQHASGYISVNLVPSSLSDRQFTAWLLAALRGRPELAGRLRFEITEVEKLQVASCELALLESLRVMGFDIYLDDFGSGYASFELLKRIPVNGIKLDGSVVRDYLSDPVDQALVQAAIALAGRLKIKLIAEGVETEALLQVLRRLGIRNFQGYLFHRPQAWQQVSEWVGNQHGSMAAATACN